MASTYFFVVLAITVGYVLVKRANLIPQKEATARLKEGASSSTCAADRSMNQGTCRRQSIFRLMILSPCCRNR